MSQNSAAIQEHIKMLMKNNLLENEVYKVEVAKLNFEINTI